jgi:hypothetical protein
MSTVVIGVLVMLSGYLGLRLKESKAEILSLRANVASLKRRFVRMN